MTTINFLLSAPAFKAAQHWDFLLNGGRRPPARRQQTRYFDTPESDLWRHRMSLRIHNHNKAFVMVFDAPNLATSVMILSGIPDITLLGAGPAKLIGDIIAGRVLQAVFVTDIRHAMHRLVTDTSHIEISFDAGNIISGNEQRELHDVEMRLKSGDAADLYRLGISFAETFGKAFAVQISSQSKAEIGALLFHNQNPEVVRAVDPLQGAPTVDEAIGALISTCINQFIGNFPAFETGDAPKSIHQMRVAMRRLRSALGLFQRSFPCAEFAFLRQQAKNLAAAMGESRDWDVFIELIRNGPLAAFPAENGFGSILAEAESYRMAGYQTVRALLADVETTRFILSVQNFVAKRGWRNALSGEALLRLTAPASEFAAATIIRQHHKLLKRGKNLHHLSPHGRHEVRKDLKKLRYTADFFGGLLENRAQMRVYTRATANIQDQLGIFNDLVTANTLIARLDAGNHPDVSRAAGIIIGWCGRGAQVDDTALRKAWKKFSKTKLFKV